MVQDEISATRVTADLPWPAAAGRQPPGCTPEAHPISRASRAPAAGAADLHSLDAADPGGADQGACDAGLRQQNPRRASVPALVHCLPQPLLQEPPQHVGRCRCRRTVGAVCLHRWAPRRCSARLQAAPTWSNSAPLLIQWLCAARLAHGLQALHPAEPSRQQAGLAVSCQLCSAPGHCYFPGPLPCFRDGLTALP